MPDGGGFYLLTRAVGVNKAAELAMTGRPVTAEEGKLLGFVASVVSENDFESAVFKAARRFAYGPSESFAQMKKLIWDSQFGDFEDYIEKEVAAQSLCSKTDDFREGVSAFVEKRRPDFQ